jgi:hypothetical protein
MISKPVDAAIEMVVGPLIDDGDFKTLETAIAHNAVGMDVDLIQEKTNGTTVTTDITLTTGGGSNDWTHLGNGYYKVQITDDENTEEGTAYLVGKCNGVLAFRSPAYQIVPPNNFDSLTKGTDMLQVDVQQFGNSNGTFASGRPDVNTTHAAGTAWGNGAITMGSIATGAITSSKFADGAIDAFTFTSGATSAIGTAAADAVWDEATSGHTVAGTFGEQAKTDIDAIKAKTDTLPASPAAVGSAMTLTSGERNDIANALLGLANGVESGVTVKQALRRMAAVLAGITTGAGTGSEIFQAAGGTATRVTVTVDAATGNRTGVAYSDV